LTEREPDIKTVFFDIGATLISGPPRPPNKLLLAELGLAMDLAPRVAEVLMTHPFETPAQAAEKLEETIPGFPPCLAEVEELWQDQEEAALPVEAAGETVQRLAGLGFKPFLVSNIWVPYFRSFLRACPEIAGLACGETLSFRLGVMKPDHAIYRAAIATAGVAPAQAVMVGDSYDTDILPAIQVGLRTAWVLNRPDREKTHLLEILNRQAPMPDWTLDGIADLPEVLCNEATDGNQPTEAEA